MQAAVADVWGREEARTPQGQGAGGDGTVYVDRVAEEVVLEALQAERQGRPGFLLISEEVGERAFGDDGDVILLDPIDGSHNAKMGIPYFSITLAAARGRTYGSVYEAAVRNLATGEHYEAASGRGAWRNGIPLKLVPDGAPSGINVLQVEPTQLEEHMPKYTDLLGRAQKIRMLGSAALNICLCATGAISVSVAPSLRSVDCAASLLVLQEAGGVTSDFAGNTLGDTDVTLARRTSVVAAASPALLALALDSIRMGRAVAGDG